MVRFSGRSSSNPSNPSNRRQKYALVKWANGVDEGTYTHNVNVDWILHLDGLSPTVGETYAIEWRNQPRPKSGWPVWDAVVLDISSDLDYLAAKMAELEEADEHHRNDSRSTTSDGDSSSGGSNTETPTRRSNLIDINSNEFRELLRSMARQDRPSSSSRQPSSRESSQSSDATPSKEMVRIGKSLFVEKGVYIMAKHATSPGRIVRPLLRQAFSRKKLMESSYAGQRRTVNGNLTVKPGLKKYQKMADIQGFVLQKYPSLSQSSFGAIVNQLLGPEANAIQEVKYVDDSEEEEME